MLNDKLEQLDRIVLDYMHDLVYAPLDGYKLTDLFCNNCGHCGPYQESAESTQAYIQITSGNITVNISLPWQSQNQEKPSEEATDSQEDDEQCGGMCIEPLLVNLLDRYTPAYQRQLPESMKEIPIELFAYQRSFFYVVVSGLQPAEQSEQLTIFLSGLDKMNWVTPFRNYHDFLIKNPDESENATTLMANFLDLYVGVLRETQPSVELQLSELKKSE